MLTLNSYRLGFIIYSIIRNHLLEWQQHDANPTKLIFPAGSKVRFRGHSISITCDDQASALAGVISGAASAAGASAAVLGAASAAGAEAAGAVASPSQ